MAGIVEYEPIDFIRVSNGGKEWTSGSAVQSKIKEINFALKHRNGRDQVALGQLLAVADADRVNRYLAELGVILILRNFLKSLVMVLLSYWLFQQLVHRHIIRISRAIRQFKPQYVGELLQLESNIFDRRNNELDGLVSIVNAQQQELRQNQLTMLASQQVMQEAVTQNSVELRQAHEQLLMVEKVILIGQLAVGVAHQFHRPLEVIKKSSERIQRIISQPPGKPTVASLDKILSEQGAFARLEYGINCCDRLIEQLREYSNSRKQRMQRSDIFFWIKEYCEFNFDWPSGYSFHLRGEFTLECAFDPCEMSVVLANLLQNSVQAMAANPLCIETFLTVSVIRHSSEVKILIEDTGGGVNDAERIFEPFFSTKQNCFGLGLLIARKASEAQGGVLNFDNSESGCIFTLTLPLNSRVI